MNSVAKTTPTASKIDPHISRPPPSSPDTFDHSGGSFSGDDRRRPSLRPESASRRSRGAQVIGGVAKPYGLSQFLDAPFTPRLFLSLPPMDGNVDDDVETVDSQLVRPIREPLCALAQQSMNLPFRTVMKSASIVPGGRSSSVPQRGQYRRRPPMPSGSISHRCPLIAQTHWVTPTTPSFREKWYASEKRVSKREVGRAGKARASVLPGVQGRGRYAMLRTTPNTAELDRARPLVC